MGLSSTSGTGTRAFGNQTSQSLWRNWWLPPPSAGTWLRFKNLEKPPNPEFDTVAAGARVQSVFFLRNIKLVVRGSGAFANCTNLCNWQHWETVICYYNTGISGVRIGPESDWLFSLFFSEVFAKTFQRHNLPNIKSWSGLQSAWLLLRWENVWTCVNYYVDYLCWLYHDYYDYHLD